MSGQRYVCQVVREFGSIGPQGLVMHSIGDELVRDTPPVDESHLVVLRVESAAEADASPSLVVNPASEAPAQPAPKPARKRA